MPVHRSVMAFVLASPSFAEGETIPDRHAREHGELSPELAWSGAPTNARSFALVMHDPDAPSGDFTHWLLWDIPPTQSLLAEGAGNAARTSLGIAGKNSFGEISYGGPRPPPGHGPHRYFFELYALGVPQLGLSVGASRAEVEAALKPHTLAGARLMGRYETK
jgi:Raf kinase inhibitor-like YbhB/YbcL family protein